MTERHKEFFEKVAALCGEYNVMFNATDEEGLTARFDDMPMSLYVNVEFWSGSADLLTKDSNGVWANATCHPFKGAE